MKLRQSDLLLEPRRVRRRVKEAGRAQGTNASRPVQAQSFLGLAITAMRRSCDRCGWPTGAVVRLHAERSKSQAASGCWEPRRAVRATRPTRHASSHEKSPAAQKIGRGTEFGRGERAARAPRRGALRNLIVQLCTHERGRHAITAAPTKRPLTLSVLHPAVVTVTEGSAWTPVATLLYFRKGQTWFALICPQREQRYFLVSLPSFLVFRDGAGDIDVVSGSTKSGSAAFVGFRRRPVLRAAREGF